MQQFLIKLTYFIKKYLTVFVATATGIAGILIGSAIFSERTETPPQDDASGVAAVGEYSILPTTEVTWIYSFHKCGEEYVVKNKESVMGLSQSEIERFFPQSSVIEISNKKAVIKQKLDGCCPQHFLVEMGNDNKVRIYQTNPTNFQKEEIMPIETDYDLLSMDTIEDLRSGLLFSSMEDINKYFEAIDN